MKRFRQVTLALFFWVSMYSVSPLAKTTTLDQNQDLTLDTLMEDLTLEELMNLEVVSPSKVQESLSKAPATVIVISRQELVERGYNRLDDFLNDMPGMDVVRPYGDEWFKNYWRGLRQEIGAPYLIMIDGSVWNHLYTHMGGVLATFPMNNIERVEVVYGPASSIYGANAFMGVINVITRAAPDENGFEVQASLSAGSHQSRAIDLNWRWRHGDWFGSVSARLDVGDLDPEPGQRYEYSSDQYLTNPLLWGDFTNQSEVGGRFHSSHNFRGFDLRLGFKELELAVRYFDLASGYGLQYATDKAQNHADWSRPQWDAQLTWNHAWSDHLTTSTRLRYRESHIGPSQWVQGVNELESGLQVRRVSFSWWRANSYGLSLHQDFQMKFSQKFSLHGGLRFNRRNFQKAYAITYGPELEPGDITSSYPFPLQSDLGSVQPEENRIATKDFGVYLEGRWNINNRHRFHLGARLDNNSEFGTSTTVRGGWVGEFGPWTLKALFGESFREPNPRVLYGGWTGSGSDPDLEPERSQTLEVSARYTREQFSHHLGLYQVRNSDIIEAPAGGADNLGSQKLVALDYHFRANLPVKDLRRLTFWIFYSRILSERETKLDALGMPIGEGQIGDLAHQKVNLGLTAVFTKNFSTTLRGRYVGSRDTVDSNPIDRIGGFATFDLATQYTPHWWRNTRLSLSITNLFDRAYAHPGVRSASAGDTPGAFNLNGEWQGSNGFFNSLLPQPGREFTLKVSVTF